MHTDEQIHFHQLELTSRSGTRPRGLYLNLLTDDGILLCDAGNYIAKRSFSDVSLLEIKGNFTHAWRLELQKSTDHFWLCFQFMGRSDGGKTNDRLSNMQYRGHLSEEGNFNLNVKAGKISLVLLGLPIADQASFQREWPALATVYDEAAVSSIGYLVNRVFERIQQYTDLPFSAAPKMQYHMCQLLDIYNKDVADKITGAKGDELVLYHRAISYITAHYQDEDISTKKIAEKLRTSVRNLYRAFEGKHITINGAIQTIRLYKGRELLRETDASVDMIAYGVKFSTAKYFAKQFAQLFGHSPAKERELNAYSKKKLRKMQRMKWRKLY